MMGEFTTSGVGDNFGFVCCAVPPVLASPLDDGEIKKSAVRIRRSDSSTSLALRLRLPVAACPVHVARPLPLAAVTALAHTKAIVWEIINNIRSRPSFSLVS